MARKKFGAGQLAELTGWGIPLPPTDISRFRLWDFVKRGSTQWGADEAARIVYAQQVTGFWNGKRVRSPWHIEKKTGTARYLVFRSRSGVQLKRHTAQIVNDELGINEKPAVGPFDVAVEWDGASRATMNSPAFLEILPEDTTTA